jgi:hypothetical protein
VKHREILLLLGALLLLGTTALIALGGDPPPPPPGAEPAPRTEPETAPPVRPGEFRSSESSAQDVPRQASTDPRAVRHDLEGPPPDSGIVDGRLQLTAGVAGKFSGYTIYVREMASGESSGDEREPFARSYPFKAEPNMSPLYFAIDDLPFSRHGYEVSVFVPGFNGSTARIACTPVEWNPQVTLWLSKGGAFALRLIDQRRDPVADRDVVLRPVDWPPGRPVLQGKTDSFGTVVFERALGGDYDLFVGRRQVERLSVALPGVVVDAADVGVQSKVVTVPSGQTLRVEVFNAAHAGLAGAELTLTQIDTVQFFRLEEVTDYAGIFEFPDVPPGSYQLDVRHPTHQPRTVRVEVPTEGEVPATQVRMAPQR